MKTADQLPSNWDYMVYVHAFRSISINFSDFIFISPWGHGFTKSAFIDSFICFLNSLFFDLKQAMQYTLPLGLSVVPQTLHGFNPLRIR